MRKIFAIAALLLSSIAMADDRVTVSGIQVGAAGSLSAVTGLAHNNSNATLANVFVKFKLYDGAGNIVENTVAHGQDIGPGENWKFSAPAAQAFSRAELSSVTVY
ncbi:FxLYD domain-containing protein [Pseudomonas sp. NPDC089530]|uniref:FxLYD domain-containing protein n=1 Tax=Pseudomonas sp. NPDC089530 TaxID=3390651 RepID=UPI003D0274B9